MTKKFLESFEELVAELDGELVQTENMGRHRLFIHKDDKVIRSIYANPSENKITLTTLKKDTYQDVPLYGKGQWWIIEYHDYYSTRTQNKGTDGSIKIIGWPVWEQYVREWMQ